MMLPNVGFSCEICRYYGIEWCSGISRHSTRVVIIANMKTQLVIRGMNLVFDILYETKVSGKNEASYWSPNYIVLYSSAILVPMHLVETW